MMLSFLTLSEGHILSSRNFWRSLISWRFFYIFMFYSFIQNAAERAIIKTGDEFAKEKKHLNQLANSNQFVGFKNIGG